MTEEQRAFWGAIAQILPVIALALVVEVRVPRLASLFSHLVNTTSSSTRVPSRRAMRRVTERNRFVARFKTVELSLRILMYTSLALAVVLFVLVEYLALSYLTGDRSRLFPGASTSEDYTSGIATVVFGMVVVAVYPLMTRALESVQQSMVDQTARRAHEPAPDADPKD